MESIAIEDISPEVAEEYLTRNTNNRNIRKSAVDRLVRDMRAGRFTLNSTIIFAEDGELLDGQHRLMAVVESGCTVQMIVLRGASKDSLANIDTGVKRSAADALKWEGLVSGNCNNAAATYRSMYGVYHYGNDEMWRLSQGHMPTHQELLDFARENHDEADPLISWATKFYTNTEHMIQVPLAASLRWVITRETGEADLVNEFFEGLETGADLDGDSPILLLRRALFGLATSDNKGKMSGSEVRRQRAIMVVKAWNAWIRGRKVTLSGIKVRKTDLVIPRVMKPVSH